MKDTLSSNGTSYYSKQISTDDHSFQTCPLDQRRAIWRACALIERSRVSNPYLPSQREHYVTGQAWRGQNVTPTLGLDQYDAQYGTRHHEHMDEQPHLQLMTDLVRENSLGLAFCRTGPC